MAPEPAAPAQVQTTLRRDIAMVLLAVASVLILAAESLAWVGPARQTQLLYVDLLIVAVFWVEYIDRFRKAPRKRAFVAANWYELPGMVPIFPGMERFASLRFLRLLRVMRIMRLVGALRRFDRIDRAVRAFTRRSKLGYVFGLAALTVLAAAIVTWVAEPADSYPSFWDALWWAIVTATTVGYGDFYPVTAIGRIAGVALMLLGIGLIGTFAATLSSFLVERTFEPATVQTTGAPVPGLGIAMDLERLARLRDHGHLTQAEFEGAKRAILEFGKPEQEKLK